ncbi:T9SS type A sorting domain-containing protein [Chryseobacterium sp. ISL-6]|uniref:T9SS type A sorting domain-containing protein n=1 Tax=Chryseobacterium sp. ISL-6 TaxID=2819143 RepID=UPI001BE80FAD|nr:T9SS type A sorting domain-containing protein [Chryseobacterium sp. ISL-6]MBT2623479.1 T9SS type A sorting domain-containing protein [Chryseobacterium sp. ISL-6]
MRKNLLTCLFILIVTLANSRTFLDLETIRFPTAPTIGQSANVHSAGIVPPPANDECSGAVLLPINPPLSCTSVTVGSTVGATQSMPATCGGNGLATDDVWFKFVATATTHLVEVSNTVPIATPMNFQVFSGSCGSSMTSLFCHVSGICVGTGPDPGPPICPMKGILSGLIVGQTYYVRVYESSSIPGYNVNFNICVRNLPVNDDCQGALIASSFPYSYTQVDGPAVSEATTSNPFCSSSGTPVFIRDGTWFRFIADGSLYTITVTTPSGSTFDPAIGVYGGVCSNFTCLGTVNSGSGGQTEILTIQTNAGTVYYINVGGVQSSTALPGIFTINITKGPSLGISEALQAKNTIDIYPNPFIDLLNISDIKNVKSVSIVDISGRLLKTIDKPSSVLQLKELKSGTYVVVVYMKDGSKQTFNTIKK